jgi:hypothetical protein
MPEELKLELERREKVRKMIALAENLYANEFAAPMFAQLPTFTEEMARQFLRERSMFTKRWLPSRFQTAVA